MINSLNDCKGFTSLLLQVSVKERLLTRYQHTTDRETGPWALTASDTLTGLHSSTEPQHTTHTHRKSRKKQEEETQRVRGNMTKTHTQGQEQKSRTVDNLIAEVREHQSTRTESESNYSTQTSSWDYQTLSCIQNITHKPLVIISSYF